MTINRHCAELASIRLYEQETSIETVARQFGLDPRAIIDFSLNVNPFGSPQGALAAAAAALPETSRYPDVRFSALRSALAERHGVGEDNLFFGSGLDDVIKLLIQALTSAGDAVLVHLPTFPRYELEARLTGCRIVEVENEAPERIDVDRIRAALEAQTVAIAFLCTPNNPTGARIETPDIEALVRRFPDTIFIVDEALIFPLDEGAMPICARHSNAIVLRTFSKYFGLAGLRVGYAVGDPSLLRVVEVGRPPFNMTLPSVAAATAALEDDGFLQHSRSEFTAEVGHFVAATTGIERLRILGSHANMMLLETAGTSAAACSSKLASMGLVVADATSFRGLEHLNVVRVSLRDRPSNQRLISALADIL